MIETINKAEAERRMSLHPGWKIDEEGYLVDELGNRRAFVDEHARSNPIKTKDNYPYVKLNPGKRHPKPWETGKYRF